MEVNVIGSEEKGVEVMEKKLEALIQTYRTVMVGSSGGVLENVYIPKDAESSLTRALFCSLLLVDQKVLGRVEVECMDILPGLLVRVFSEKLKTVKDKEVPSWEVDSGFLARVFASGPKGLEEMRQRIERWSNGQRVWDADAYVKQIFSTDQAWIHLMKSTEVVPAKRVEWVEYLQKHGKFAPIWNTNSVYVKSFLEECIGKEVDADGCRMMFERIKKWNEKARFQDLINACVNRGRMDVLEMIHDSERGRGWLKKAVTDIKFKDERDDQMYRMFGLSMGLVVEKEERAREFTSFVIERVWEKELSDPKWLKWIRSGKSMWFETTALWRRRDVREFIRIKLEQNQLKKQVGVKKGEASKLRTKVM